MSQPDAPSVTTATGKMPRFPLCQMAAHLARQLEQLEVLVHQVGDRLHASAAAVLTHAPTVGARRHAGQGRRSRAGRPLVRRTAQATSSTTLAVTPAITSS